MITHTGRPDRRQQERANACYRLISTVALSVPDLCGRRKKNMTLDSQQFDGPLEVAERVAGNRCGKLGRPCFKRRVANDDSADPDATSLCVFAAILRQRRPAFSKNRASGDPAGLDLPIIAMLAVAPILRPEQARR